MRNCLYFLLSFSFLPGKDVFAQRKTVLITYNTLKAFQEKEEQKEKFIKWINGFKPDIVAMQELNGFTQQSFEKLASLYGHPYAVLLKEEGYPVGLTSRYPITDVHKVVDGMHHGYIYAKVKQYHVFVVHLTPSPKNFKKRKKEMEILLAQVNKIAPGEDVLFMGDFNAFSIADSSLYREPASERPEFAPLENGRPDYSVVQSMTDAGFTDAFRYLHNRTEKSYPTVGYEKEKPHRESRFDYIWLNASLKKKCIKAEIIKDGVTDYLSDHYPVLVELKN